VPVRKEGNCYVVDFRELAKQWLPQEVAREEEVKSETEGLTSPVLKSFFEKRRRFFEEVSDACVEWFRSILEFLDAHKDAKFRRKDREVELIDHSLRTAEFAFSLTGNFQPEERAVVILAALAHDLGKATVEENLMKEHPEHSFLACQSFGMVSEDWDRIVAEEKDPLALQTARMGNAVAYLVRYHHQSEVPSINTFTADNAGLLKRLLVVLKRADSAAAKFESGECGSEAEALSAVITDTKKYQQKAELKAAEETARKQLTAMQVEDRKVLQLLLLLSKGVNGPADGKTASKLYGYTMDARPLVALIKRRTEDLAASLLGVTPEDTERVLSRFALEDGQVLRPCLVRAYKGAPGKKEVFYVLNWEKVQKFAEELNERVPSFTQLERIRDRKSEVTLIQR
jgi:hypothetical protein